MSVAFLTRAQTQEMFIQVARGMEASRDLLTQADKAIGDGDHGVGMGRGFEAVRDLLESQDFSTMDTLLKAIGTTLLTSVGGASGAIFGTFFRGAGKNLIGEQSLDSRGLALMLADGLQSVKERGKAKLGDKTMVDALEPAALKAAMLASAPLGNALASVAEAAKAGMESTKGMVATLGKAKTLGERSLGYPDPGAVSVHLVLKFMSEYAERQAMG